MPKAPTTDPEVLRQQAAELQAQTGQVQEQLRQLETERLRKHQRAQEEFDRELTAGYSRKALDAEVEQAQQTLEAELADNPLVRTLADYLYAVRHRHHVISEHVAALGRLGHDVSNASYGAPPELGRVEEIVARAVSRLAEDRVAVERRELHERRENAGTDTDKKGTS